LWNACRAAGYQGIGSIVNTGDGTGYVIACG
jgi:hypothetical protein